MNQFELTDMNDYRLIPQLVERMNEQMRIEGEKFICERLMDLHIDKDILFNQTQEIRRLNGILQEIKDKQEQGLLINIPLKVGDVVYSYFRWWKKEDGIVPYQITNITITQNKKGMWTKKYRAMWLKDGKTCDMSLDFSFDEIGKTVFLTRSEAAKMGE